MKKLLYLPLLALLLSGCTSTGLKAEATPELKGVLTKYNLHGYTKKTEFLADLDTSIFHANCNGKKRATYYNEAETALLMGDYEGGFEHINSGYMNREGGINHFRYNKEGTYFEDITIDWTYDGQSVGVYYPTLSSLDALVNEEEWNYNSGTFTHTFGEIKIEDEEYDDPILRNFQYFAAPMLLQTLSIEWKDVQINEEADYLLIKLSSKDEVISEAKVYKGLPNA